MYSAVQSLGRRFFVDEMPSGLLSLVIAEMFYKLHSFALECLLFLATWWVLSYIFATVRRTMRKSSKE